MSTTRPLQITPLPPAATNILPSGDHEISEIDPVDGFATAYEYPILSQIRRVLYAPTQNMSPDGSQDTDVIILPLRLSNAIDVKRITYHEHDWNKSAYRNHPKLCIYSLHRLLR